MFRNRKAFAAVVINSTIVSLMILSVFYHIGEMPFTQEEVDDTVNNCLKDLLTAKDCLEKGLEVYKN